MQVPIIKLQWDGKEGYPTKEFAEMAATYPSESFTQIFARLGYTEALGGGLFYNPELDRYGKSWECRQRSDNPFRMGWWGLAHGTNYRKVGS